jgi:hypothetical protein
VIVDSFKAWSDLGRFLACPRNLEFITLLSIVFSLLTRQLNWEKGPYWRESNGLLMPYESEIWPNWRPNAMQQPQLPQSICYAVWLKRIYSSCDIVCGIWGSHIGGYGELFLVDITSFSSLNVNRRFGGTCLSSGLKNQPREKPAWSR